MIMEFHTNGGEDNKKNNFTPSDLPKKNENLQPHKDLHTNVLSSISHNSQKLETNY